MEPKEITKVVESKVSNAYKEATEFVVKSDEDMSRGALLLTNIKKLSKYITSEKENVLKPLREATSAARALFAPLEERTEEAEKKVRLAMATYNDKQEAERKRKEDSIVARAEAGQLKEETAVRKLEELPEVKTTVRSEEGAVSFRKVRKVKFAPLTALSAEELVILAGQKFIIWDEAVARKAALAGLLGVGVAIYEETEVATRV